MDPILDGLNSPNPDPPVPSPIVPTVRRSTNVDCEFCGCVLSPNGDVLRRGERATKFMDLADTVRNQNKLIEEKDAQIAALSAQVRDLTPPPKKGLFDF